MNEILQFLQSRNSAPKLCGPAPDDEQMREIFSAAVRAPDHAWLRPWRFVVIAGDRRREFGEELGKLLLAKEPETEPAALDKARNKPLRAPMIVVVVACLTEHPKVPRWEQRLSAGCTAHAMLLAAEAQGFAGVWRTGSLATDPAVGQILGIQSHEQIVGFVYLGTREREAKPIPDVDLQQHVSHW